MSATRSFFTAARPAMRQTGFFTSSPQSILLRNNAARTRATFREQAKRFQSTTAPESQSWFMKMWNSPIGFKTVHFWAPVMKWGLVLAGVADFARPAEKLSLTQNGALTATGVIWTRWCLIIKPKNYLLAAVNFFLGCVGIVQVGRILLYRRSQKALPAAEEAKEAAVQA